MKIDLKAKTTLVATGTMSGKLSPIELSYMAGIVDGEGTITIVRSSGFDRRPRKDLNFEPIRREYYRPKILVSNTNFKLIEWILDRFGGKARLRKSKNSRHKDSLTWVLERTSDVAYILELIRPYLLLKREQCDLTLSWCRVMRRVGRVGYSDVDISNRTEIEQKIRLLNFRGK